MAGSTRRTAKESRRLKVLGTLNEYQARLFVADKALDRGRGGMTPLSEVTGMSQTTIAKEFYLIQAGDRLNRSCQERTQEETVGSSVMMRGAAGGGGKAALSMELP